MSQTVNQPSTKRAGISRRIIAVIVLVLVVAGAATLYYLPTLYTILSPPKGGGSACGTPSTGTVTVNVGMVKGSGGPFNPENITIVIGVNNTVTWTNDDPLREHHTVTLRSNPGVLNSGDMAPGATFTCSFITPGTYNYYCIYHPLQVGTIIVKAT